MIIEVLDEILCSLKNHQARFILSGMSVFWGMFILVILLGASGGLVRGMTGSYFLDRNQIVYVEGGSDAEGRQISLTSEDATLLESFLGFGVKSALPMSRLSAPVEKDGTSANVLIRACVPGHLDSEYQTISLGREIDKRDIDERSRVCVLNDWLARALGEENCRPGDYVTVDGLSYMIVGICSPISDESSSAAMYIPISTYEMIYRTGGRIDRINIVCSRLATSRENENLTAGIRSLLCRARGIGCSVHSEIYVDNSYESMLTALNALRAVSLFVWIIGIATLLGGMVGVANIMYVGIRERIREFGILRSCGATKSYILSIVVLESVFVTLFFGCLGMISGVWLMKLLSSALGSSIEMFTHPTADFLQLTICLLILVMCGVIAGYMPARKASSIKIIEALHDVA